MRWIIYSVIGFALIDILILNYRINNKADVFAPGLYVILLGFLILYTFFFVSLIENKGYMVKYTFLSVLILMPCFIYLIIHAFLIFWWFGDILKMILPS
jgi:hypothetical protein